MRKEDLTKSLLTGVETAKALTEILHNALAGACTLEKMCEGEPETDEFSGKLGAASMHLMDAAKVLAEATYTAIPSISYV